MSVWRPGYVLMALMLVALCSPLMHLRLMAPLMSRVMSPLMAEAQQPPPTAPAGIVPPDQNLPPHIRKLTGFGERAEFSLDSTRVLFLSKTFGDAMEIDLTTGVIRNLTTHFPHYGFTRALYLSNGHILLSGPTEFDPANVGAARTNCWLFVLDPATNARPQPLNVKAAEGPVPSRKRMHIAWSYRAAQFPGGDMPPGSSQMHEADIVYEQGRPKLANQRKILDSRDLPFKATLEPQNYRLPDERELIFSAYDYQQGEVFGVDLKTGKLTNYSNGPGVYDEPEGIFPSGEFTTVESDKHNPAGTGFDRADIHKLKLDGSGAMERLTFFADVPTYRSSNPVVSDDGRYMAFQMGRSGVAAGIGYGLFLYDFTKAPPRPSQQQAAQPQRQGASSRWWMDQPIRFLQTNISEKDSTLDPVHLIEQVADFPANTFLFNMGGIVAQYPTRVPFHYASPHLPAGRDLFGDVVKLAHARGMRVVGRFDLSKTQKAVFDAHPEWFFERVNGEPAIYNGLYSACINGGYYREHALKILSEALERYEVDGLFFNMFGNPSSDYSGQPMGPCHCAACQDRFHARYGRPLPTNTNDPDYATFMADSSREVAKVIGDLIHQKRPKAAFLTYISTHTDGIMSESNTAVTRALPMWPYSASDNVNRARNSEPDKMAINLAMAFVDYPWRYVTVPPAEMRLRLYQNMAHGGPPAMAVVGTMNQEDRAALIASRPIYRWHAAHEELYVGQQSAARVLLLRGSRQASYRGFFRLLSEQHIPFAVSDNLRWMEDGRTFDLVIAPDGVPADVERYVRTGGRLLVASATPPPSPFGTGAGATKRGPTQAAWRIHDRDRALLPSLKDTNLLFIDGEYAELTPAPASGQQHLLTFIPPAMFGPPEKVWVDKVETTIPGLLVKSHGERGGRVAWVPWDVGGLYYRHSSQGHSGLMVDLIDHLLPDGGRQLKSSAHPLVEITVMRQPARKRTFVHLVNLSGHADTAYFDPIAMRDISIDLGAAFTTARAVVAGQSLPVTRTGAHGRFVLPTLGAYEVIVLDDDARRP